MSRGPLGGHGLQVITNGKESIMSAPETNVEKQKRRHGPVLLMILGAVALVVIAAVGTGVFVEEEIQDDAAPDIGAAADPGDG